MPTVAELGQRVKAKYPGSYDQVDDAEVGRRVKAKYPGSYDDFRDIAPEQPGTLRAVLGSTVGAVGRGIGNVIEGTGGAISAVAGPNIVGDTVSKAGKYLSEQPKWVQEAAQSPNKWTDPVFLSNLGFEGAGSALASFAPGGAVGRAANAIPRVAQVVSKIPVPLLRKLAEAAPGTVVSAFFESITDAGSAYNDAIEKHGASPETAAAVFRETLKNETAVTTLTSLPEHLMPKAGKGLAKLAWAAANTLAEGGEEVAQGVAQRAAKNEVLGTNTPLLEGALEEFVGGALGGGVMAAGRLGANRLMQGGGAPVAADPAQAPVSEQTPADLSPAGRVLAERKQREQNTGQVVRDKLASTEGSLSLADLSRELGLGAYEAGRALKALVEDGSIKREGGRYSAVAPMVEATPVQKVGPVLGGDLAKKAPRYPVGSKSFLIEFESDLDKAAYITAQKMPSKYDTEFVAFVAANTGLSEPEIRAYGAQVRAAIKTAAAGQKGGTAKNPARLVLPSTGLAPQPQATAAATEPPVSEPTAPAGVAGMSDEEGPIPAPPVEEVATPATPATPAAKTRIAKPALAPDRTQNKSLPKREPAPTPEPTPEPEQPKAPTSKEELAQALAAMVQPEGAPKMKEAPPKEKFEGPARARKVEAYVDHLERNGFTPEMVDQISRRQWFAVAQSAGLAAPSSTTIEAIRAKMRTPAPKVEVPADPFAAFEEKPTAKTSPNEGRQQGWVGNIAVSEIAVDPVRFQFKRNTGGKSGVGDEFREVRKWDPEKAGIVAVWKDPQAEKTYVVNGHHRVEMAQRLGVGSIAVRYLSAGDSSEARLKGAMINIAEGRGDSIDAAKVFRDSGISESDLAEQGVSLKGKVASEGIALSRLHPSIFGDVLSGDTPPARAATIGAALTSHEDQKAIYELIQKAEERGKRLTNDQVSELIRQQKGAPQRVERQESLFGEEIFTRSLVLEKAEVSDYVRKQLSGERKLFSAVGQQRAAEKLGKAGNVIDASRNQEIAEEANRGLAIYDKLSLSAGEITDALDAAAEEVANGNGEKAKQQAYSRIRDILVKQIESLTGKKSGSRGVLGTQGLGSEGARKTGSGQSDNEKVAGDSSVYLGSGLGSLQAWFDKQPNPLLKVSPRAWFRGAMADGSLLRNAYELARPIGSRISSEGGVLGKEIMSRIEGSKDAGERLAGERMFQLRDASLDKLSNEEAQNLLDALEGRQEPMNARVRRAYAVAHNMGIDIAEAAVALEMEVIDETGEKRPFEPGEHTFPHIIHPVEALESGPIREDIIRNVVHIGEANDTTEAARMLDEFIAERKQHKEEHIAKGKQPVVMRYGVPPRRYAPLEIASEDNPFYDPDPRRVLPMHAAASSMRIAFTARLGQDNSVIQSLISDINKAGANAEEVKSLVDRALQHVNQAEEKERQFSRLVRTFEGFKLGLASVNNITQGPLNSLLYGDMGAVATGIRAAFTSEGKAFAIRAGALIDPVMHEQVAELAGSSRRLDQYLRLTGFHATERANRVLAANAGAAYAKKLAKRGDSRSREVLAELGLDPQAIRERGGELTADEVLMAAKKFSDITQFRSRPEDLPAIAAHPIGKIVFQFRSFAYAQARFVYRNTVEEAARGHYGRGFRNLLLLGLLFPIPGELIRELRAFISGRERKKVDGEWYLPFTKRWFDDIAAVGTLGIAYDAIEAGEQGRALEMIAGPAAGEFGKIVNNGSQLLTGKRDAEDFLRRAWKDHLAPRLGPLRGLEAIVE